MAKLYTFKFGYNDHGYKEFTAKATKICRIILSEMVSLLHKVSWLKWYKKY